MMKWGLNLKFICYTVFIVVFISLVFSAVFIFQSRKALLHEFRNTAESLVKNLALNIEVPLFIENQSALVALALLLRPALLRRFAAAVTPGCDAVAFRRPDRPGAWHACCALYHPRLLPAAESARVIGMKNGLIFFGPPSRRYALWYLSRVESPPSPLPM